MDKRDICLNMNKTIFFDFDGVLVNSEPVHRAAFLESIRPFLPDNRALRNEIQSIDINGKSTTEILIEINIKLQLDFSDAQLNKIREKKQILAHETIKKIISYDEKLKEIITDLSLSSDLYVVTSGSERNVKHFIQTNNLINNFKDIITSRNVLKAKPDPEIYFKAINMCGMDIENICVIEDSAAGINSAYAAGLKNIFYLNKYTKDIEKKLNWEISTRLIIIKDIQEVKKYW